MPKITRLDGKLDAFASEALGTERTIFGSEAQSDNLTDQLTALFKRGWGHVSPSDAPTLQDFNALGFTATQLLAYLHQMGVPEYNERQDYYSGSVVTCSGALYISLADDNIGNTPGASGSENKWRDLNEAQVEAVPDSVMKRDADGRAQVAAPGADADIANKRYVDEKIMVHYELCEFYYFRHPTLKTGFQPAQGGLLTNAAELYPEAWAYLQTAEGQKLCKTEAEWQAMTTATWATLADGTTVGWNGIGGAPFYAPNTATGALRLPDLRGMYAEAAGFDSLGVGGVQGDGIPPITGTIGVDTVNELTTGAFVEDIGRAAGWRGAESPVLHYVRFDSGRVLQAANKVQVRSWGALPCVYLGRPK